MSDHPDRWGSLAVDDVRLLVERPSPPKIRPRLVIEHGDGRRRTLCTFVDDNAADDFMGWLNGVRPLVARARLLKPIPGLFVVPDPSTPLGIWLHQSPNPNDQSVPPTPWATPALYTAQPDAEQIPPTQEGHDDDHHPNG